MRSGFPRSWHQVPFIWPLRALKWECPQRGQPKWKPHKPCPLCGANHWRSECPGGPLSVKAQTTMSLEGINWGLGLFTVAPPNPTVYQKPRTSSNPKYRREGKLVDFLLDTRANFSVLLSTPGQLSKCSRTIRAISGKLLTKCFPQPLGCLWGNLIFSHSFLIMPESLTPFLERDIITKLEIMVLPTPGQVNNYVSFWKWLDIVGCRYQGSGK